MYQKVQISHQYLHPVDPQLPTGVSLNKTTLDLEVGGTETLTATVTPLDAENKTVTWTSSDPAVATVSTAGKVTAVSEGTCKITVSTKANGLTAECNLTVSAASGE